MFPRLPPPESLVVQPFVRALPAVLRQAAPFGVALVMALLVRHLVVEPAPIAHACDPAPWSGACALRTLVIESFATQGIGWAALGAGLVATLLRSRWIARAALALGGAGLVLYSFAPSAFGALLAVLVLVRERGKPMQASASSMSPPRNTTA